MNDSLYNRYQQAKQQNNLQSMAESANYLNVTEAELIYACANADDAKRLNIAKRLNFDYIICFKNRSSRLQPISIFLRFA